LVMLHVDLCAHVCADVAAATKKGRLQIETASC